MLKTLYAAYNETDAVKCVLDELINHGIDREKIYADEKTKEVRVMVPDDIESEINEVLNRHHPV